MQQERKIRKVRNGVVVSSKMEKTVVVKLDRKISHPKYRKIINRSTSVHAHDEKNECKSGDKVKIMETKPLSKNKRWRVVGVLEGVKA